MRYMGPLQSRFPNKTKSLKGAAATATAPSFYIHSGPHVPRRRLILAGLMCRIRFPRVPLKRSPSRLLGRLTVRMTFCMGPHVPRRRFSFARRECGVRFSKVPLFGGACSKVGEDALQATWKDSISFASTKTDNAFCSAVEQAVESRWSRVRIPYALTESQ